MLLAPTGRVVRQGQGRSLVFDGWRWVRDVRGEIRVLNKDPFAQATQCMHEIIELMKQSFIQRGGGLSGLPGLRDVAAEHPAHGLRCWQAAG